MSSKRKSGQLFDSLVNQALAETRSRRSGQRFTSLALLEKAAEWARHLNLTTDKLDGLRNATLAALLMPDLFPEPGDGLPASPWSYRDFDDALEVYVRIDAEPHLALRWYFRGQFHQKAGRHQEALADLRRAVAMEPNRHLFCNALARLYATGPAEVQDAEKAVELAGRAVRLLPGNWSYYTTLGVAYYRAGRYEEAVAALEASLRGTAGEADAHDLYFLAMSHRRLGDVCLAMHCFERAQAWHDKRAGGLTKEMAEELGRFRAEAEAVLGRPAKE